MNVSGILLLSIVILLVIVVVVLLWLLLFIRSRRGPTPAPLPPTPGPGASHPTIPDTLDNTGLTTILKPRLAGTPADGSAAGAVTAAGVIWVDGGDEVLVHLDNVTAQIVGQTVLISIDLETDQTGRTPLVVPFAVGAGDEAGLVAATDEFPRGNGLLAARWGGAVQEAAWSALLSLAADHATERGQSPRGLAIANGQLKLIAGEPLKIV